MSTVTNIDYLTEQVNSINTARGCEELNKLILGIFESINKEKEAIEEQLAQYAPMLALLEIPKTPEEVIEWVGKVITHFITPQTKPATSYIAQLAAIATAIATLTVAIENAISKLSCSIEIPLGI